MKNRFVFILFSVFLFSCDNNNSCENLRKIESGMNIDQVLKMMKSSPDSILIDFQGEQQFTYMYNAPFGASENIYINFSQNDSIVLSAYGCE